MLVKKNQITLKDVPELCVKINYKEVPDYPLVLTIHLRQINLFLEIQ